MNEDGTSGVVDSSTYQTLMTVRADNDVLYRVEEQLESWLRNQKAWDVPTERTGFYVGPQGAELMVLRSDEGTESSMRTRLIESGPLGTWRTTLTAHESGAHEGWVGLRVSNSERRFAAVPRLARYLLEALEVRDGETWLSTEPKLVHAHDVEDLLEQVTGFGRQGLFFVVGSDETTLFPDLQARASKWADQVLGLAQVAVLDPAATSIFNEAMGASHAVEPDSIRTFKPEVDPAVETDGLNHRYLTRSRLARESDRHIAQLLGRVARRHASTRTPPDEFRRVDRRLARLENKLVLRPLTEAQATAATAPTTTVERPSTTGAGKTREKTWSKRPRLPRHDTKARDRDEALARVKSILGVEDLEDSTLQEVASLLHQGRARQESVQRVERTLRRQQERIEDLQTTGDYYKELYEDEQLDSRIAEEEASRLSDEVRWLRHRLAQSSDYETAYGALPEEARTSYPEDFAKLREWLPQLEKCGVFFTGDEKELLVLDEYDTLNKLVRVAWDSLLVLTDYVRARNGGLCEHGVRHYLEHTPEGYRTLPPSKFASKETRVTMNAWGDLRSFPVPLEVDPNGLAVMEAHFKLGRVGMVSPRMYYLDCWSTNGHVYVGYIGAHLRNTMTN